MVILPYKMASVSAKNLAQELGVKRIRHEGRPIRVGKAIINWGCSVLPDRIYHPDGLKIINVPLAVQIASNKLESFRLMDGHVPIPAFTIDAQTALEWLTDGPVVCRTRLNGHSGEGIVIAHEPDEIVRAPLYTKYIKKNQEYRIHVMMEEAFFVQRKARKLDVPDEEVNWQVRNHQNGFIYANQDVEVPAEYREMAIRAVRALGLDFGAVDIISKKNGEAYVLEVNTAPGLAGTTLEKYRDQIKATHL